MALIHIRLSEEEKEKLQHDAHMHEKNMSEYIRWLIFQERFKNKGDA